VHLRPPRLRYAGQVEGADGGLGGHQLATRLLELGGERGVAGRAFDQ
jgi:hypothetical protein